MASSNTSAHALRCRHFPLAIVGLSIAATSGCDRLTKGGASGAPDGATVAPTPAAPAATAAPAPSAAPACQNISGTWATKGSCGRDVCIITQTGCTTSFKCSGGSASYAGSVEGSKVKYAGKAANGQPGSCEGTFDGTTLSGTCDGAAGPCTFSATKK